MREGEGWIDTVWQGDRLVLQAGGCWVVTTAADLDRRLKGLGDLRARQVRIDLSGVEMLDTAGAWLVLRTGREFAARGLDVAVENVPRELQPLLRQVEKRHPAAMPEDPSARFTPVDALAQMGRATIGSLLRGRDLLGFFGLVCVTIVMTLRHPRRLRFVALVAQMQRVAVSAMPIVGLLSFVIGIVFAYQGADQLRRFGADLYTVDLLAISVLRELGSMLTAIIVAGRSGSAFTAEIGAMEVNEEIDALRTLGLDPIEVLVLPRVFGLVLTLPLLTFYANFMALLGGALMSWAALGIPLSLFLREFQAATTGWSFWLGVLKAPFFAATIAMVGCHAGFRVSRSAESVGRFTTLSVVESIFLVIIIDALFSILFSRLHI